jgi:hypothetical protein
VIAELQIDLTRPQIEIANDPHKIAVLIAGRGWGKTLLAHALVIKVGLSEPGTSAVIMPIQSQAKERYQELLDTPGLEEFIANKVTWPFPVITWKGTGHRTEFRSFDEPKRLRGGAWSGIVVLDEANDLDGKMVRSVILLKAMKSKARVFITSTITHENWLWDLYLRGLKKDPLVRSWMYTTPEGIAYQGPGGQQRLADFKSLLSEYEWKTECLCQPTKSDTACFPFLDGCLVEFDQEKFKEPEKGRRYIIGLDLGRTRDHTVYTVSRDDGLVVARHQFELGLTHGMMAQRVAAVQRYYNGATVVIDATGAGGSGGDRSADDSYVKEYQKEIPRNRLRPLFWSPNSESQSKKDIISNLMLSTEQKKIQIPRSFGEVIEQMRNYKVLVSRNRRTTGFGCPDGHDDYVASLAMSAWGLAKAWLPPTGNERGPDDYAPTKHF